LAAEQGRPARLFRIPRPAINALRRLPIVGPPLFRLTASLQVDDADTRAVLDWQPPVSVEAGLAATAAAFRSRARTPPHSVVAVRAIAKGPLMPAITEDTLLIRQAIAYAIELYRELTKENGAPSLGTQNQVVDFILADPELRAAVADWGGITEPDEATTAPPR